ncbi:hypothetical protein BSL82_03335 [Tardibacter chloracetimidivorans]|uniref:Uncharacterized protein n=1 Tax=Tardibacter chloracetimidivorans TaxID=1921510 RepID=A0A1L3ZS65_9SPHN|nr:hypothetical protein [Tardibacter chloracetimidivorans]API58450.1 hypothetical protein BSL82_03335 [Tardibacter chloracetimidivorans]
MIFEIIKTILGIGGAALQNIQARQAAKAEAEARIIVARAEAEVKRLEKAQDAEIAWDSEAVSQMRGSWKDEWWTFLASLPLILAFLGDSSRQRVTEGFAAISHMPDWYIAIVGASVAASFGIRALVSRFGIRK